MINRKLVRPSLSEIKDRRTNPRTLPGVEVPQPPQHVNLNDVPPPRRRQVPPEQTSAESFYYVKQMNNRTPMVVVLDHGEELHGQIEWYDRNCIKVNREGAPNLLVYKHAIKYLHKENDDPSDEPGR